MNVNSIFQMTKKQELKNTADRVSNCKKCDLYKTRIKPVPGDGNLNSDILFIGEAPGRFEDQKGLPFVGRAGIILDDSAENK